MQSSTLFFSEDFCWSRGAVVTMKDISAFLDMRRYENWAHKIGSWKYLSEDLFCQLSHLPQHRGPHFCSPPWTLLRGCWKSVAVAAHGLILVEVDATCQFVADRKFNFSLLLFCKLRGIHTQSLTFFLKFKNWSIIALQYFLLYTHSDSQFLKIIFHL